jgi:hypothetical protein
MDEMFEGVRERGIIERNNQTGRENESPRAESAPPKHEKNQNRQRRNPSGETRQQRHKAVEERIRPFAIDKKKKLLVHARITEGAKVMNMTAPTANHLAEPAGGPMFYHAIFLRVFLCSLCFLGVFVPCRGEDAPDAREILKTVRINQSAQNRTLRGSLRTAGRTIPFRLVSSAGAVRYEFTDPPLVLQLRLGAKDSRLEEITKGSVEKVTPARFDTRVRDTGISYEDLSLHFLYWQNAAVQGEQTMVLQKCWIIRAEPDSRGSSQYSKVLLWIGKNNGALMQAEAYDANGKVIRRFKVISGQKTDEGLWILKEMRIESMPGGAAVDRTPTYLEIDGVDGEKK